MSIKTIVVLCSTTFLFSCFLQENKNVKVVPQFISSAKGEATHLALIVKTINNTDNKYIFLGGHSFLRYFRIAKLDKSGKWRQVVHPSDLEINERNAIESKHKELSYYKDDYHSRTPLFGKWAMSSGIKLVELDHLDLTMNSEISESPLFKNIEACVTTPFSLFFVEKRSTYEQFWNMDFMLSEKGHYRVFFAPDAIKLPCNYNFKGFQLSSNQTIEFDSTEIVTN